MLGDAFHLASVGQEGARQVLRELLSNAGYHELKNFVVMA
jgi:hypothetical protein